MFHYFNQNTMKKFISALAVVFAIAASYSCQREVDYITDPAQAVTVTYSVSLDQVQKTKATLADLDALAVDKLFYSVYQSNGTAFNAIAHSDYHGSVALTGNTAELQFKLIQGETYKLVFWAQKGDSYITSAVTKDSPLGEISIDYTACDSYAADRDAFTAWDEITLDPVTQGADFATSFSKEIHLKRPFAQVNFGTDDAAQAAAQGYVASKVQVIVKQAATKFNALTGVASEPVDASFKEVALPETPVEFDINNATYTRVAKAYVLPVGTFTVTQDGTSAAISSPLSTTPEVSMILSVKKGENVLALDPRSRANTSIRSNYRTNLLGHLITTDATFNVVVDNDYDGSTDHISIVSLGNATGSGAITMGEDETVSSNINFGDHPVTLDATMTIEGNVTISSNESNSAATITVNAPIVVTTGSTLTLEGVTIDPASTNATITIQPGATVIVNGGTYTADGDHDLFDLLTNSNPNPAPAQPGMHFAHGADGDQLIIRGGVFVGFNPTPYVDDVHYSIVEDPTNTWTVTAKQVTLTVEAGDVNMKVGDEAVLKTLTVDPADTDLSGISFEYSVANVAAASYSEGKISIAAVGAGSTVITVKVGAASAIINVTVLPADSIEVAPASLSLKVGQTSEAVTVTLNNNATVSSVASNNANATVNWTSGNTFTVTGAAIGESTITVTASNGKTATVAVTVSKADAVKLAAPVLSTENAVADETSIFLSWTAVEHATGGYTVIYNNVPAEAPVNSITLSNLDLATEYTISVVAKGDGDAYTDSDASNSIKVTTDKGTVSIAIIKDEFDLIEGTDATVSQAQIQATVKYGTTEVNGAALTYAVKDDDLKGNVTVSSTGLVTAGAGEAAATILVNYAGNATYKAAEATVTVGVSVKTLESITLGTDLVKKTFELKEEFTHANIVVTANYNNNTTADVTSQAEFSSPDMTTAGDKTVTVSFGGKSAEYTIHVNDAAPVTLSSVAITTPATKTAFTAGEAFDASGLVLTGTYSDQSTKTLTPTFEIGGEVVTSGVTALNTVSESITVTVYSAEDATKTATYTISVAAVPVVAKTIAEIKALVPSTEAAIEGEYTIDAVVTGVYGETTHQSVFIEDSTGGILIYGCSLDIAAGQKIQGQISGLSGKTFNGLKEITAITVANGAIKDGGTIPNTVVTLAQIAENMDTYVSRRVKVEDVTFTSALGATKNSNVTIDGVKIYVSDALSTAVEANTVNDLVGYPTPYNTTKELCLWDANAVTYKSTIVAPAVISGVPSTLTLSAGDTYDFATVASVTPSGASLNYAVTSGNGTITSAGVLTVNSNASNGDEIVVTVSAPAVDNVCLAATPVTCTVTVGVEESLAGDYVIAAYVSNKYHAMTSTDCGASTKRFASEEISYSGSGSITVTNNDKLWSLEKVPGGYILKAAATNTYFGWDGSSNGAELKAQADALVLTFTENSGSDAGTYSVVPVSNSAKNLAKNGSNAYFGIYNTGQANKIVLIPASYEAPTEYSITYALNLDGGSVSGPASAYSGAEVTITATPAEGKKLKTWAVTDANNQTITVTSNKFTMPASNVNVSAEFEDVSNGGTIVLSEEFDNSTTSDSSSAFDSNKFTNFSGATEKAYTSKYGGVKFGSSNAAGYITSKSLDLSKAFTVEINVLQYGSDTGKVQVTVGDVTKEITPTTTDTAYTLEFEAASSNSTIKIGTSAKRAYIDNVVVTVSD